MNPWRGLRGLPREVWVLFATMLVNRAGTMALPFLVLYLTRSLGFAAGRAGLALFCYGLGSFVTAPVSGRLSDSLGARRIMKLSLFLSGGMLLGFPVLRSFPAILALTFLWSVTGEAFRPASLATVVHVVAPGQRKAAFALVRLAVNLGMSIGPVVGGFLTRISYPALFWVDGATSILAGLVLALSLGGSIELPAGAHAARRVTILPNRHVLFFLAALLPVAIVFFQLHGAFPLFLVRDLHLSESAFGLLLAVNTLLIIFLEVPLNLALGSWPHRKALALGALLTGAGFGALAFATSALGAALTVVVWTFGEMILLPGSNAYVADLAPPDRRGAYMGFQQMTFSLALSAGAWMGTAVLDRFGPTLLWSAAFLCGILSAALMSRLHVPDAQREGPHA